MASIDVNSRQLTSTLKIVKFFFLLPNISINVINLRFSSIKFYADFKSDARFKFEVLFREILARKMLKKRILKLNQLYNINKMSLKEGCEFSK